MADKTVTVKIQAQDQASSTLKKIGTIAKAASSDIDKGFTNASKSADRFSKAGAAVGAVIGTTLGVMSDAARLAAESEVSQQRLQTAIEATGASWEEYADQVDTAAQAALDMSFDDEAAQDALAAMTAATGDAGRALELLSVAMDVARGRGIDLSAATNIVIAAEQGRMGVLARLGIQLDENATAQERIAAIQTKYAGQAEAYAGTAQGAFDRFTNSLENHMEALGGVAGRIQPLLMMLPGLSAGFTGLSAVVGSLSTAGMLGPVGLVAGAGAAAFAIYQLGDALFASSDFFAEAEAAAKSYEQVLMNLAEQGLLTGSVLAATNQISALNALNELDSKLNDISVDFSLIEEGAVEGFDGVAVAANDAMFNALTAAEKITIGWDQMAADGVITVEEFEAAWASLGDTLGESNEVIKGITGAMPDILTILQATGDAGEDAQADLVALLHELESGFLNSDQFIAAVNEEVERMPEVAQAAANAVSELTDSMLKTDRVAVDFGGRIADLSSGVSEFTPRARDAASSLAEFSDRLPRVSEGSRDATAATDDLTVAIDAQSDTIAKQLEVLEARNAVFANFATDALSAGFGAIVGNTNAIGSQAQQAEDWAKELINVEGEIGKIDDLLARGVINQQEYNDAQEAYNDIARENTEIQDHILDIQTKQAPVIAELMAHQEDYLDNLADLPAMQQLAALGFADSAETARIAQVMQAAALATTAEGFEAVILSAAEMDPVLAAMLEKMGVISIGTDGTITVHTEDAMDDTLQLADAIDDLVQVYEIILDVDINGDGAIGPLQAQLNNIAGTYYATVAVSTVNYGTSANAAQQWAINNKIGGTVPHAATGVTTWVGEAGPELVNLPIGSQVTNHPASMSRMGRGNGGGNNIFYGPVTLQPAGNDAHAAIYAAALRGARS